MSENLQHIDDLFRNGMEGREEMPAPLNWDKISSQLDEKERRRPFLYFRLSGKAAAIALILLGSASLFAGGYLLRGYIAQKEREQSSVAPPSVNRNIQPSAATPLSRDTTIEEVLITEEQPDPLENGTEPTPPTAINPTAPSSTSYNPKRLASKTFTPEPSKKQPDLPDASLQPSTIVTRIETTIIPLAIPETAPQASTLNASIAPDPGKQADASIAQKQLQLPVQSATATASTIPVASKNKSSIDRPRFSLLPVVQLQSGDVRIDADNRQPNGPVFRREFDASEKVRYTEGFGLMIAARLSKSFSIQSGFVTNGKETTIQPKAIRAERRPDGKMRFRLESSAGTIFIDPKTGTSPNAGDTTLLYKAKATTSYVQIPVQLNYQFGKGKLQGFLTAGTGIQLLNNHRISIQTKHNDDDDDDDDRDRDIRLKDNYLNGIIGGGVRYQLSKHTGLYLSPQYQFALSPSNKGMVVNTLPRAFTVQAGLSINW